MKAKRRIESSLNSVTMLDGTGGHVTPRRNRQYEIFALLLEEMSSFLFYLALCLRFMR